MRLINWIIQRIVRRFNQERGDVLFCICNKKNDGFCSIYGDSRVIITYLINVCKADPSFYHIFNEVVNHCLLTMDKKDLENNTLDNQNTEKTWK